MITEDYVSLEIAKLLNTKGFKGEFHKHYWGYELGKEFLTDNSFNPEYDYPAPTLQTVMKWLREVHKLAIDIEFQIDCPTWKWRIYHIEPSEDKHTNFQHYDTYEQACEVAIKYCLENLI